MGGDMWGVGLCSCGTSSPFQRTRDGKKSRSFMDITGGFSMQMKRRREWCFSWHWREGGWGWGLDPFRCCCCWGTSCGWWSSAPSCSHAGWPEPTEQGKDANTVAVLKNPVTSGLCPLVGCNAWTLDVLVKYYEAKWKKKQPITMTWRIEEGKDLIQVQSNRCQRLNLPGFCSALMLDVR